VEGLPPLVLGYRLHARAGIPPPPAAGRRPPGLAELGVSIVAVTREVSAASYANGDDLSHHAVTKFVKELRGGGARGPPKQMTGPGVVGSSEAKKVDTRSGQIFLRFFVVILH
jgi:hypothetical protein